MAQHFKFTELPPEVRNMVYGIAASLSEPSVMKYVWSVVARPTLRPRPSRRESNDCFNLLQSCRLIRHEFLHIYYNTARFAVSLEEHRRFVDHLAAAEVSLPSLVLIATVTENPRVGHLGIKPLDLLPIMSYHMEATPNIVLGLRTRAHGDDGWYQDTRLDGLFKILMNGNSRWRDDVKKKRLGSVFLLDLDYQTADALIHIVYRVGYEKPWMRKSLQFASDKAPEADALGLIVDGPPADAAFRMGFTFGVQYF